MEPDLIRELAAWARQTAKVMDAYVDKSGAVNRLARAMAARCGVLDTLLTRHLGTESDRLEAVVMQAEQRMHEAEDALAWADRAMDAAVRDSVPKVMRDNSQRRLEAAGRRYNLACRELADAKAAMTAFETE